MSDKTLYIIAGCNGAGKTTASFTILPEILGCKEFVNADEIARGLSPFRPDGVAFEAGRIMLQRVRELLRSGQSFALETTLATKSYRGIVQEAQQLGYWVVLMFFWLESTILAKQRVQIRVAEGGHNIEESIIKRRYYRGVNNLFNIYLDIVDKSYIFDNSAGSPQLIVEKSKGSQLVIHNSDTFNDIKRTQHETQS